MSRRRSMSERLASTTRVSAETGCVEWTGPFTHYGYGRIRIEWKDEPRRSFLAHRVAWEQAHGPIPEGMCVLHRCDNPPCANPEHLFLGTDADNVRDMHEKRRDRCRGEEHGAHKLTDAEVVAIREAYTGGESHRSIARRYGVSQSHISKIMLGKTRSSADGVLTPGRTCCKLTPEQEDEASRQYAAGRLQREIAADFGVHRASVARALARASLRKKE